MELKAGLLLRCVWYVPGKDSNIEGIYPCGEGAGYAGGITSAAMDGIKTAEFIAAVYREL